MGLARWPRPIWSTCIAADGQDIAGRHYYRPRLEAVAAKYASQFGKVKLFTIDEVFGGWQKAQTTHSADGGVFDQIYKPGQSLSGFRLSRIGSPQERPGLRLLSSAALSSCRFARFATHRPPRTWPGAAIRAKLSSAFNGEMVQPAISWGAMKSSPLPSSGFDLAQGA